MKTARRWLLVWMGSGTLALAGCSDSDGGGGVGGATTSMPTTGSGTTTTTTEPPPCAPRPFEPLATDARVIALAAGAESVTALISASDSLQTLEIGVSAAVLWPKDPDHAAFHGDLFPRADGSVCAAFLEERADGSLTPLHISCNGNAPVSTQLTPSPSPTLGRVPIAGATLFGNDLAYIFTQNQDALTLYSGGPTGWEELGPVASAISYPVDAVSPGGSAVACYIAPDQHVTLNYGAAEAVPRRDEGSTASDCRIAFDATGALYITADDRFAVADHTFGSFTTQPIAPLAGTPVDALAALDGRPFVLASSAEGRKVVDLTTLETLPLEIPPGPPGQSGMVIDASGALVLAVTDDTGTVHVGAFCP